MRGAARLILGLAVAGFIATAPAGAATSREILTNAAFVTQDKAQALAQIDSALQLSLAALARDPHDREAQLQQAIAIGYRAKLKHGFADAKEARRLMEVLIAQDPNNAEAHAALAGWHLDAVAQLGNFVARTMLGAKKDDGLAELDTALRLGGNRALFPAMAALTRIQVDRGDVVAARALAARATTAETPTVVDRVLQKAAATLLPPLRQNDGRTAQAMAERLLPFGRLN
ncbi:hypothetical protein [Sphingomonas quercus]|uniref:Uncharacterized protein n=1 Tax=Sphingomonas quercus TaxID=2842451 RepID=A0ABS6BIK6_9SPHN|nr:hypothetical protein [Sphingomonas quercus]MBU3078133.1 hypothetical protein [Sphingomonas quercus]